MRGAEETVDEIGMPLLRKAILVLIVLPAALAVLGLQARSGTLRRIAIALWVGGMAGAVVASGLWFMGY